MSDEELVSVPKRLILMAIDMALTGDAGMSGWMDDEEVDALRALAIAAGMDPIDATPSTFKCKHRGTHDFHEWLTDRHAKPVDQYRRCHDCGKFERRDLPSGSAGSE